MSKVDTLRHSWWEDGALCLLDQRLLPGEEIIVRCRALDDVVQAIKTMQVRGAPAIGCTAAYGMALVAQQNISPELYTGLTDRMLDRLADAKTALDAARPTAVNLAWATNRVLERAKQFVDAAVVNDTEASPTAQIAARVLDEAHAILAEDLAMCHAMGRHGVGLIPPGGRVLTHCNAGGLATAGYGTAL